MFKFLSAMLVLAIVASGGCGCGRHPTWTYKGDFHRAIAKADRMVIVDAGFDCYGRAPKAKILFEMAKPDEVRQFAEQLEFQKGQTLAVCNCNGYPRVDWYEGKTRVVTASIQHAQAIRWKGFHADAKLTSTSSRWLLQWLSEHGVDLEKMK
jgi:hypothetical protein